MLNVLFSTEFIDKILPLIKAYFTQTIITTVISTFITLKISKINERNTLLDELRNIMKYSMEYPFLENEYFTNQYEIMYNFCKKHDIMVYNCKIEIINRYYQYEIYCEMIFNYISKIYDFYKFNEKKINKFLDVYGWIKIHSQYWYNSQNHKESVDAYGKKFVNYIDNIYKKYSIKEY